MSTYDQFLDKIENLESKVEAFEKEASECFSLKTEIQNMTELRAQLFQRYGNKYGVINNAENRRYSVQELEGIRAELADTSLLTLLKRFFGIGKKNEEIYADLMGKLCGLLNYLNEQLKEHSLRMETAGLQLKRTAEEYEKDYKTIQKASGCSADTDWGRYQEPDQVTGNLYFGDVDIALDTDVAAAKAILFSKDKEKQFSSLYAGGDAAIVRAPYTRSLQEPIQFLYEYKRETSLQAIQSVKSLVYQILRMAPAYYMEFHLMDGENTGSDFAELMDLQKVRNGNLVNLNQKVTGGSYKLAQVYMEDKQITEGLENLERYMSRVAEEMGAYDSIEAYNKANSDIHSGKGIIPYQVVIIQNFPTGFTDKDTMILDKLIRNGVKRGVSIILMNNQDRWLERQKRQENRDQVTLYDKLSRETLDMLDRITLDTAENNQKIARVAAEDCSSTCRLQMMLEGKPNYINSVIAVKNAVVETDNYFPNVIDTTAPYGQLNSKKGLHIPFAIDRKGQVMEYCLGEAMNAHGLICGGTGSGKSTLLHMLISSIVMNYSPSDVEIWLADYKITEFYSYKFNTPPHIRFIGLSKTSDFSYAFIDKIKAEMDRRQELIAEADVELKRKGERVNLTNFNEYRKSFGLDSMRRLIVIIDEFHVMAQHAQQEIEYKEKLENLLAEARALGIILLFSDQAIVDGLRGLSEKGKKQIKARIALSNYEDELKETLGEKDREKIKPFLNMKTGEVAVQTVTEERDEDGALKEVTHIERGMGIYIDGEWRFNVNETARKLYHAESYVPDSFDDKVVESADWGKIAEWEKYSLKARRKGGKDLQIYLGRPLNLQFSLHFPLLQRKGNNIMSIAGSEEQQMQILKSVVESFIRQKDYNIVVMTEQYASLYREYDEDIRDMTANTPNMALYEDLNDICYQINVLLRTLNNRGNTTKTLVVWLGLDIIADLLREESNRKPEVLKRIVQSLEETKKPEKKQVSAEKPAVLETMSDLDSMFANLFSDEPKEVEKAPAKKSAVHETMSDLDKMFANLFDDGPDEVDEDPYAEYDEEEIEESYLYNACDDIEKLLHIGPSRNIYNLVIYDTSSALKDFRGAKISDFGHKIAFAMSDSDASDFLERSNLIKTLPETMAFYYNGRAGKKFIPYKL